MESLFRDYGPLVHRRALRILGNSADAEEATQEIFIRVINGIERFDGRSQLSTWLFQITTNLCLNRIRDAHIARVGAEVWYGRKKYRNPKAGAEFKYGWP
mgnify:CR=1 FL=1